MALDGGSGGGPPGSEMFRSNIPTGGAKQKDLPFSNLGGKVYLGREARLDSRVRKNIIETGGKVPSRDNIVSANEAYLKFFEWGDKKRKDFIAQGVVGGLLKQGDGLIEAGQLWKALVQQASIYNEAGKKITPWDVMSTYVDSAGGAGSWVRQGDWEVNTVTGERRYVGPQFKTTTDKRVDFTDPRTAQAIATQIFQNMMGRNPGDGEISAFAKALMSAEKKNPVLTSTTTEYDMTTGEPIATDTTQTGGLTAEARGMIGQNQVKKDEEYGAYQAATTYFGALQQAVYGSPG